MRGGLITYALTCGGDDEADLTTKTITANGTYKAAEEQEPCDGYSEVTVNVPTTGTVGHLFVTANGTYTALDDHLDGYDIVVVDVGCNTGIVHIKEVWANLPSIPVGGYSFEGQPCNIDFTIREKTSGKYVGRNGSSGYIKDYSSYSSGTVVTEYALYGGQELILTLPPGTYEYVELLNTNGTIITTPQEFTVSVNSVTEVTYSHTLLVCLFDIPAWQMGHITAFANDAEKLSSQTYAGEIDKGSTSTEWNYFSGDETHWEKNSPYVTGRQVYNESIYNYPIVLFNNLGVNLSFSCTATPRYDGEERDSYIHSVSAKLYDTDDGKIYSDASVDVEDELRALKSSVYIDDTEYTMLSTLLPFRHYSGPVALWHHLAVPIVNPQFTRYNNENYYETRNGNPEPGQVMEPNVNYEYTYTDTGRSITMYSTTVVSSEAGQSGAFSYGENSNGTLYAYYYWRSTTDTDADFNEFTWSNLRSRINGIGTSVRQAMQNHFPKVEGNIGTNVPNSGGGIIFTPSSYSGNDRTKINLFVGGMYARQYMIDKPTYVVP